MKTGNGKIANLPPNIQDELNYRITDGESGNELVEWLNSKPEVVKVIGERFDGIPISEQNLSEWRKRGYQKWLAYHNTVDESNTVSGNVAGLAETGIDCDKLLLTLTAAYAEMTQNWIVTPCEQMTYKLGVYKNLINGVISLQRAELQKVRLEIDRERLEILCEKRRDKSAEEAGTDAEPHGLDALRQSLGLELAKRAKTAGGLCMQEASGDPGKSQDSHSTAPAPTSAETPPTCQPSPTNASTAKNASPVVNLQTPSAVHPKGLTPQVAQSQPSPQPGAFHRKPA
jgi:hypothetical protein